jgi:hypothetical protein
VESRRAWLRPAHHLVPAQDADHAELDGDKSRHGEVVDTQHDVHRKALERGRPAERDRHVDVLVGVEKWGLRFREAPADEHGEQQRHNRAEHREACRRPARPDARQGDDERSERRENHQRHRPPELVRGVEREPR